VPARTIIPLFEDRPAANPDVERARQMLLNWDFVLDKNSVEAGIYVAFERQLLDSIDALKVPSEAQSYLRVGLKTAIDFLLSPDGDFGTDPLAGRDQFLQDVLQLCHEDITDGSIRFRRKKNRDFHLVPLHSAVSIEPGFGPLFPELGQLPLTGSRSVSARFREDILPRIGIVQEYHMNTGGNKAVTEYSFHSLRHMLSTELNRAGVSAETRMALIGHDDQRVSSGYTHAGMTEARAALEKIAP
jgi:hypothetical protein